MEETSRKPMSWWVKIGILVIFSCGYFYLNIKTVDALGYVVPSVLCLGIIFWAVLSKRRIPAAVSWIFCALVPVLHLILLESLQQHTRDIVPKMLLLNVVFFYSAFFFLFFLCRKHSEIAVLIGTVLTWLCTTINAFCWEFRSLPVLPWDLYSAKTGLSVAGNYQYTYTNKFWLVMLLFATIAVLGFRLRVRQWMPQKLHWPITAVSAGLLAGFLVFCQTDAVFDKFGGYRYLFTPTVYYERNGTALAFLSTLHYLRVDKPAGYDAEDIAAAAALYTEAAKKEADATEASASRPNVIVIMNEAFSDLYPLGDYTTNLPVLPFIDSLTENTWKGNLHVSVKGGNTANTEYEFLTGDTMAFLPAGSIPYQQYIKAETPCLTTQLKNLGYQTAAIHPYYANGWFRDSVYPYFGFDLTVFLEDLRPLYTTQMLRGYYSDAALFTYIQRMFQKKEDGEPLFVFAVTMQNHGSYDTTYDNFRPDVKIDGLEDNTRLSAYLSLIRQTDAAFENLVSYFSETDEKTVILMFGDHQPNDSVVYPLLTKNGVAATTENLDLENRYITPCILWANYEIEMPDWLGGSTDISANYLSALLCDAAGIPLSGYQTYLAELYQSYPVISGKTVLTADGEVLDGQAVSAMLSDTASLLHTYQTFAYSHIFREKERPVQFYD